MPEHGFAVGHLQFLASIVKLYPRDALKIYFFGEINRRLSRGGACYLDLWPFAEPFLLITSPHLANQVVSNTAIALEKPDALRKWFWPITGGISIFDAPAAEWKPLRALFNRAFSTKYMMALVPAMVEETQVYCEILREKAKKGDMFYMDPVNLRLMLDVIGRTGLYV
jgi:cytochrome P450